VKTKQIALIATALMSLSIINSSGQDYSAFYEARLSAQDHTTSNGAKLSDVASILRQDRANYHKFKKRDADDQTDNFFSSAKNRVLIDSYFKNVYSGNPMSAKDKQAILSGTPLVRVSLVDGIKNEKFLSVEVLSR
jgi:type III secretory pathway component EscR